jgi:SAP domain-containing ribonucleoprotein
MATDYSKKTNAELVEILKARSLPHTGKKADMVSRLQQADETAPADAAAPTTATAAAAEDVIDWDDEPTETPVQPSTETGAAAIAAGGQGAVPNPVAVPNQKLDENPATTDDLKVEATGAVPEAVAQTEAVVEAKPAVDYTRGLPTTDLEAELAKRKARAEKFGIVEDEETALKEATKQLERAKRFGTGAEAETGVSRLDQALPDQKPRKRQNDSRDGGRGGKRRDTGRRDNGRGRGRRDGNRDGGRDGNRREGNKTNAGVKKPNAPAQNKPSEKDIAAMEARKKRFAAAA